VLERQGGVWMVTAPVRYRADDVTVGATLAAGKHIELTGLVSYNPEKRGVFQLDSSGTEVTIYEHGAPKAVFWIGKPSTSYTETYVRRDGSDDVYLATGMFSSTFARRTSEWRDKTIFKTEQDAIGAVTLRFGDTTVVLARQDSVWKVGNETAKNEVVKSFTGALANLQAAMPPLIVQIEVAGTQILLYQAKGADKYTVRTSLSPQLFEIYNWKGAQLVKRKKDFVAGT